MDLAEFAGLERMDPEDLRVAAKNVTELISHPGWAFVHRVLASQQDAQLKLLLQPISKHQPADAYGLQAAEISGMLRGLKYAYEAPHAVLQIADRVMERNQKAAEAAARRSE